MASFRADASFKMKFIPYMGFFAFVGIMALVLGYAWWWNAHGGGKIAREREDEESRRRGPRLKLNGWEYDPTHEGDIRYRVHGTTAGGFPWRLDYDSDHSSSSSSPRLIFRVESLKANDIEWYLIDRWAYDLATKGVSGAFIGGLASIAIAMSKALAAKTEFFRSARTRATGSAAFRERFALIADTVAHDSMVTPEIEKLILQWPEYRASLTKPDNCLSARLDQTGLEVKLHVDGPSVAVIEQLVKLGSLLADASAKALRLG